MWARLAHGVTDVGMSCSAYGSGGGPGGFGGELSAVTHCVLTGHAKPATAGITRLGRALAVSSV